MSENGESSGSEDLSSLTSFFFYVVFVHPATAWILRPGRFERKKSIIYAIAFLAGLAAIKTGTCPLTWCFMSEMKDWSWDDPVVSSW